VDDTSDLSKPVSTATQAALNLKENLLVAVSPLKKTLNMLNNIMEVSVDQTSDLIIKNLTATDTLTAGGDVTVSGSRLNVVSNITNTQVDGLSCLNFNNISGSTPVAETAQIWNGQSTGLNIVTNTAHPIKFSANRQASGAVNSIEIQGTGTRNVVINSPLMYKPYASLLITTSTSGAVSFTNFGYITPTSISRAGHNNKAYTIAFPAHPNGNNFAVIATAYTSGSSSWDGTNDFILTTKVESGGTGMSVWCRRPGLAYNATNGLVDGSFYVYTVP
jgi:hypothetical protein